MPIVRILLVLLALASPALAQEGARNAAAASAAAQAFQLYLEGVTQQGGRPDLTRPDAATMLGRVFDLGALTALPPAQASDSAWLLEWHEAANETKQSVTSYGAKPGLQPDMAALRRNMAEYEDQYATATNFLIRLLAREAVATTMLMASVAPETRTPEADEAFAATRRDSPVMIMGFISSVQGSKPANARLVTAAIRDTSEVWASHFLPADRAHVIAVLPNFAKRMPDETTRTDLAALLAALQAAK
jgi:hypothetical protein